MRSTILSRLAEIEENEHIKIVYACESGSRAWGFASKDSDYDVRFIYLRSMDWYLSIDEKRDVIEIPIDETLDINGWDMKKALRLLRKTNSPLLEWLGSPIIYIENTPMVNRMRQLAREFYSTSACMHHYQNMARGNFRGYLQGDTVRVKKYFYVLRPILAVKWIEKGFGVVPTEFATLVDRLVEDEDIRAAIYKLRQQKLAGNELDSGPKIAVISNFIQQELDRWERLEISTDPVPANTRQLDLFFHSSLREVWAGN